MRGQSRETGFSGSQGGGMFVQGGTLIMADHSRISDNTALRGGVYNVGTVTMSDDASVTGNTATTSSNDRDGQGGGSME